MCCMFATLAMLGPRAAILIWWLIDRMRFTLAFGNSIVLLLGFLFLPWTTLVYALIWHPGAPQGLDWVWIALALLVDVGTYSGGVYRGRERLPRAIYVKYE